MSSYTLGYDEKYKCPCCNKFFNDVDILIENSWKCPECKNYIRIAAPNLRDGHVLIRKPAFELKKYDSIHFSGPFIYDVIDIKQEGTHRVRVALKDYGVLTFSRSDFVSIIDGGYYAESWEDN